MSKNSSDYIGRMEDKIARCITARQHLDYMQNLYKVLLEKKKIDAGMYEDARDSLTYIDGALLDGKEAIAKLRNSHRGIEQ